MVILAGLAALTGLILVVSNPSSAQGTFQDQRDPTACEAIENSETNCQDAFSSDNIYASNSGWYHDDWRFRKKFTINSTKVTADSTDFPLLIDIADADLRDDAQNDGDDILFTQADGITKLSHEIERFNETAGELVAWVNVTSLSATVDTVIFMYYGNSTSGNQQDPHNVWDDNYKGVWHLKESPNGTTDEIKDSTSNVNHGTTEGSMASNDSVGAKFGKGLEFDGSNDLVNVTDSLSLDSTNDEGTFELWIKWTDAADGDWQIVLTSSNRFSSPNDGFEWASQDSGNHFFYPWGGIGQNYNLGPNPFTNGVWHHVVVTLKFAGVRDVDIYVDGTPMPFTIENVPTFWTTLASPEHWLWGGNPDFPTRYFDGVFDEIRVSDVVRPAGWIETQYNNQNDPSTFYSVGVEERPSSDNAWKNLGFNLNATDTIDRVEIGVEWFRDNAAPILNVTISWDGGATWATNQTATNRSTDDNALQFLDFTSAVSWTPSMLGDANLRARAGTNASGAHLDHIAVRVTFTTASPPGGLDSAPVVVTLAATKVTQDTAILRGSLGDLGGATSVQVSFEWGLSPALGTGTAPETLLTPATFQASLDTLNPGTTYYYRAKATGNGTAVGETLTFPTAPPALAGDLFSQLWPWLVLVAIAAVTAYLLARRQLATRRKPGRPWESAQKPLKAKKARGGLFAKIGSFVAASKGASPAPASDLRGVASAPMSSEILCPHCGTQLEGGAVYCYGCGRGLTEGVDPETRVEQGMEAQAEDERDRDALLAVVPQLVTAGGECPYCGTILDPETGNCPECSHSVLDRGEALEEKVKRALARLDLDENDKDALFTLGAHLLLDGKAQEALEVLNRLTLLDPHYPGLWRTKALVFEKLGKKRAAAWARERA